MESASELDMYAIGVDTNQDSLYPGHILTSMEKRVDVCTFQMIESVVKGTFKGGSITYMDLAHDGVGLTDFSVMKEAMGEKFPKSFSAVHAVDGGQFNLKKGEIHSLIGENGAGKSTMMKMLYGLYQPD